MGSDFFFSRDVELAGTRGFAARAKFFAKLIFALLTSRASGDFVLFFFIAARATRVIAYRGVAIATVARFVPS